MPKTSRSIDLPAQFPLLLVVALGASSIGLIGCGDDDGPPPPVGGYGGGEVDAGEDSGTAGTGGEPPTAFELSGHCLATDVPTYEALEQTAQGAPSLSAVGNTFGVVHADVGECSDSLKLITAASTGRNLRDRFAIDECTAVRNAVGRPVGDLWLMAWLDSRDGGMQVFAASHDPTLAPPVTAPPREALSSSDLTKGALALAVARDGSTAIVAWTETSSDGTAGSIKIRAIEPEDGSASGDTITLIEATDKVFGALTLTTMASGGALLGYTSGAGEERSLFVQRLDASGAAIDDPWMLPGVGDRHATLSIAMRDEAPARGAVVYSVNPAGMRPGIRFHALDATGEPSGDYRELGGALEHASGVGIVTAVGGFAIAYRAVTDINWELARIRVAFLNDVGNRVGDGVTDLAEASDYGGAPSIAQALDGRVLVSWFDDDEAGNRQLKLSTYVCRE